MAQPVEQAVGEEAGQADQDNNGENTVEIIPGSLGVDKSG